MYEFSFNAFFFGLLVLIAGGLVVIFHQKLADNLASGISSYERFKMWGLIICGIGVVIMTSLHSILLNTLINMVFRR